MTRMAWLIAVALLIGVALAHQARPQRAHAQAIQTLLNTDVWLSAVYQPPYGQTEVFTIGDDGALYTTWKQGFGADWWAPSRISPPNLAPAGGHVAAIFYPPNNQLEVFFVGNEGRLWDVWKANNGGWQPPGPLSDTNFARAGAPVTALYQPLNDKLEVFVIDSSENLREIWKANNGRWDMAPPLPSNMSAPEGTNLGAVWWPYDEEAEVYLVGRDGSVRHAYRQHDGDWQTDTLSDPNFAPTGAPLAPVYYPNGDAVEVYMVGNDGILRGVYKLPDQGWKSDLVLSEPGWYSPRAPVAAVYQPRNDQLEVFVAGKDGALWDTWKAKEIDWQPHFIVTSAGRFHDGSPVVALSLSPDYYDEMDVIAATNDAALQRAWKQENLNWHSEDPVSGPFITPTYRPDECAWYLRNWGRFVANAVEGPEFDYCVRLLGFQSYCQAQDAFVVAEDDNQGRHLACAPNSHPDTIGQQFDHIATGVVQGLETAFIAAAPVLSVVASGVACANGVLFACAEVAIAVINLASPQLAADLGKVAPDAIRVGTQLASCVGGDFFGCALAGLQGAKAAGYAIPGVDFSLFSGDATQCIGGDFIACVRLGLRTADAAGVTIPAGTAGQITDARDCLNGNTQACLNFGGRMARLVKFPLNKLAQGVDNANRCAGGDTNACIALGTQAARVAGVPLGDLPKGIENGQRCNAGDSQACLALGKGAALAVGLPIGSVPLAADNATRCANGDSNACTALGASVVGGVVPNGIQNAQTCATGDPNSPDTRAACMALGQSLVGAGLASDAAKMLRCQHGDFNACVDLGKGFAALRNVPVPAAVPASAPAPPPPPR